MRICWLGLVRNVLAGASENVLVGRVQDLVPTIGWKGGPCALPIPLLPVMVIEGKVGEVSMSIHE